MSRKKKINYYPCGCCIRGYADVEFAKGSHYEVGDDDDTPYKKSRSSRKYCKRGKGPKSPHDFSKPYFKWRTVWDYQEKKYVRQEVVIHVCSQCGKPPRYYAF